MSSPRVLTRAPGVALVGGGFIGPVHAEALRRIGVEVVGLLGSSPARAHALAERLGIPRVYRDFQELLADPRVGAVHVTSPNRHHFEQARLVLDAVRHIVCEKPLATTSAETAELVRLAASRPAQAAAVNYNVRFYPLCHEMRARVARGDLGRILSVTGSYTQDWLLLPTDYNWRVEPEGGHNLRAIADIGTHWMDLAQFVVGQHITRVLADLATFHTERSRPTGPTDTFGGASTGASERVPVTTEDYGAVLLHFADDARGVFHVSQATAGRKNRLSIEVAGTEGAMAWDSEAPETVWIGRRGAANAVLNRDPSLLDPEASRIAHYPGGHAEGFADTFKQLFLSFYGWIDAGMPGVPPFPTFNDGDREVRLCEAIARSGQSAMWADVVGRSPAG